MKIKLMKKIKITELVIGLSLAASFTVVAGIVGNNDLDIQTNMITYLSFIVSVIVAAAGKWYYNILGKRLSNLRMTMIRRGDQNENNQCID